MIAGEPLEKVPHNYHIHVALDSPFGYDLMYLPKAARIQSSQVSLNGRKYSSTLSANYGYARAVVAIFQTIYSCVTVYQARADQLTRYGYTAFGLTVTPYAVMSVVNMIGNLLTPDYPSLQVIGSDILDEACSRGGSHDGAIGRLQGDSFDCDRWTGFFERIDNSTRTYTMRFERSTGNMDEESLRAKVRIELKADNPCFPPQHQAVQKKFQIPLLRSRPTELFLYLIAMLIPIVIVGAISRFDPGTNPMDGAIWIPLWLTLGAPLGALAGFVLSFQDDGDFLGGRWKLLATVVLLPFVWLPGFCIVMVVQMLQEFGTCTRFN
ncbi:hypothetical protein MMC10_000363 [Thelotrema lepadinum]|nr:hypothetical protein [Thelotrema lepadinum]